VAPNDPELSPAPVLRAPAAAPGLRPVDAFELAKRLLISGSTAAR
jgi:hypothetical protein